MMGKEEFDKAVKERFGFDPEEYTKCKKCGGDIVACPHCMKDFCKDCEQP